MEKYTDEELIYFKELVETAPNRWMVGTFISWDIIEAPRFENDLIELKEELIKRKLL